MQRAAILTGVCRFGKGGDPLRTILKEVNKLPARINQTYLAQSNYWLTWLPLRAWAAVFDIAQVINLIWVWARAKAFGRTPREIREWTKPPPFDYAVYVSTACQPAWSFPDYVVVVVRQQSARRGRCHDLRTFSAPDTYPGSRGVLHKLVPVQVHVAIRTSDSFAIDCALWLTLVFRI